MAVGVITELTNCARCRFADSWGRGCQHGLLTPLAVWMISGRKKCPKFKTKTTEQIEQQTKDLKK